MKKLRNKVFIIIITILTLFLLTILFIYNYENYSSLKKNVENNLNRMGQSIEPPKDNFDKNDKKNIKPTTEENFTSEHRMFMDTIVYTILLDDNDNIKDIVNHYDSESDNDNIEKVATNILESKNIKNMYIGNLYTNKYSYSYIKNNTLIIIDNSLTNQKLEYDLKTSIIIFILLEIVIVTISTLLTHWIISPVQESFEKQKQFIADASHELKTPLSVIMASSEALENDLNEKKWLDNIKNEAERMNKLITNLLDLAKLEHIKKTQYVSHNLSKIVEKSILTFESLSFEKNIELKYDVEKNIEFNCDSESIKELLSILLDNAIKHCTKDIYVKLYKERNNIYLEVKNKGDAIPEGEEEKIFERFYRVDKSRNRNQNRYGLGLAIAKGIVENYNGKIKANSKNGYTTFYVVLPKK